MNDSEFILVAAITRASEQFIYNIRLKGLPFVVVTDNKHEQQHLSKIGVEHIIVLETSENETWRAPEYSISKIFCLKPAYRYAVVTFRSQGCGPQRVCPTKAFHNSHT